MGGFARRKVGPRAVVVSDRVSRVDLDRFGIVGDCAVLITWIVALLATQIICKTAKGIGESIFVGSTSMALSKAAMALS